MQLTRLIYASFHKGTTANTIDSILRASRSNNVRDRITGALVVDEQHFLQLLEGSRTCVAQCFMRIMQDDRHGDIRIISAGDIVQRQFLEWSMHMIETTQIKRAIMSQYTVDGVFDPTKMSQTAVERLCRTLSGDDWKAEAA